MRPRFAVWTLTLAGLVLGGCDDETGVAADAAPPDTYQGERVAADSAADIPSGDRGAPDLTVVDGTGDAVIPDATPSCIETLIPSPCQADHDAKLEALATRYERSFHAISAAAWDVWTDVTVQKPANRQTVEAFLKGTSWDFQAATSQPVTKVVEAWHKTAGLYAGVGVVADAFRYAVLRDQGYPAADVDRARQFLLADLDALHLAVAITGAPGAIARGFIRTDMPTYVYPTTPLKDTSGNPLPAEKNNGTWREDSSGGLYPKHIWEDSCSRDMLIGWVAAMGGAWEVIENDSTIPAAKKQTLRDDAKLIGDGLKTVRKSGFDLELIDADGRTTYHGYLNENNFDRVYIPNPWIKNGVYAVMALGIVATLAYVSGDKGIEDYLVLQLIGKRELHKIAKDQLIIDAGPKSNYSGFNMAFMGAWLAVRYLPLAQNKALADVRTTLKGKLYDNPLGPTKPQPAGWKQSMYDLVYAAGMAEATAHGPTTAAVDAKAVQNALETLGQFPEPPFWSKAVENCDASELSAKLCTAVDGKTTFVINPVNDRGDNPQSLTPVPFALRPPSNYDWRSNPFRVNGGSDGLMLTGVDFRFAYWLGRRVLRKP
jgi:hypothetical protein